MPQKRVKRTIITKNRTKILELKNSPSINEESITQVIIENKLDKGSTPGNQFMNDNKVAMSPKSGLISQTQERLMYDSIKSESYSSLKISWKYSRKKGKNYFEFLTLEKESDCLRNGNKNQQATTKMIKNTGTFKAPEKKNSTLKYHSEKIWNNSSQKSL